MQPDHANAGPRPAKTQELAEWACSRQFADIPADDLPYLKVLVLDSIGCAIGALAGGPTGPLRGLTDELGGNPLCSLIGGGRTAPGTRLRCRRMSPS